MWYTVPIFIKLIHAATCIFFFFFTDVKVTRMAISETDIEMEAQQNLEVEKDLGVTISKLKVQLAKVKEAL